MLKDPRAATLPIILLPWLGLAELENLTPDGQLFRDVDRNIRSDMTEEALLFMQSIFSEDRGVV